MQVLPATWLEWERQPADHLGDLFDDVLDRARERVRAQRAELEALARGGRPASTRLVRGRKPLDSVRLVAVTREEFVAIMSAFPTGVAIVTTLEPDGTPRGLTTNAVTSVSAEPPILLVCVDRNSRTLPALLHTKRFVVNFMRSDREEICRLFASKADDKFARVAWTPGLGGVPILHEGAVAHAECVTLEELEMGDHVVVTGEVAAGSPPADDDVPIVYFRRSYTPHRLRCARASESASRIRAAGAVSASRGRTRPLVVEGAIDAPGSGDRCRLCVRPRLGVAGGGGRAKDERAGRGAPGRAARARPLRRARGRAQRAADAARDYATLQRRAGLPPSGRVGPATRRALGQLGRPLLGERELWIGHVGWDVSSLEFRLRRLGLRPGKVDGRFTNATERALRRFQRNSGLRPDGIVGRFTIRALAHAARVGAATAPGARRSLRARASSRSRSATT